MSAVRQRNVALILARELAVNLATPMWVWDSRGSLASPGPSTVRYGGNTSSVEVRLDDGTLIILVAGTGIRELGRHIASGDPVSRINLFLSHLHLDHVEGIGFFSALW